MKKIMLGGMALALLAGCSGAEAAAPTTVTVTPPAVTVTVTATTTATATPEAASATPGGPVTQLGMAMGTTASGDLVAITALQARKVTTRPDPAWSALVKVCVKADATQSITTSTLPWSLADASSGVYDSTGTGYGDDPKPGYPMGDTSVARGQCVQGWIVFDTNGDTKPTEVRYTNGAGDVLSWKLT